MELKVKISYADLWKLITQLPKTQIERLKIDLSSKLIPAQPTQKHADFQQFLLSGPIMGDEQYEEFLSTRQRFNQWRTN